MSLPKDDVKWSDNKLGTIDLGNGNFAIVSERANDKGWSGIDVRKNFENDNGQIVPTKKGITLKKQEWQEVIAIIQGSSDGNSSGDDSDF